MSLIELQALHNSNETLEAIAKHMAATRMLNAAATAIFIYDSFLTLPEEVEFIWPKKWSVIKGCMYLNRLLSLFCICLLAVQNIPLKTNFSNKFCEVQMIGIGSGAFIAFGLCNWILLARTKALLGNQPLYNHLLTAFYFTAYGVTAVFVVMTTEILSHEQLFYSKTLRLCAILSRPRVMGFIWICPMIFETTTFLITIMRLYQRAANMHGLSSRLFPVLYRDGVSYYFIIIALRVWNLLAWKVLPMSYIFTGLFLLWAIMSIAVTRLQLNLFRALGPKWTEPPITSQSRRSAAITFDSKGQKIVRPNLFHQAIRPVDTFGSSFGDQSVVKTGPFEHEVPQLGIGNEDDKGMKTTTAPKSDIFDVEIPLESMGKLQANRDKSEPRRGGTTSQGSRVGDRGTRLSERRVNTVVEEDVDDDSDEHLFGRTTVPPSRRSTASKMESGTLSVGMDR
ncbi:hypothetical protein FRB91_002317 [Serendipita sp. 411]|nr:hypothetical protein FRB91_002317 [Serendipita sp. 411]